MSVNPPDTNRDSTLSGSLASQYNIHLPERNFRPLNTCVRKSSGTKWDSTLSNSLASQYNIHLPEMNFRTPNIYVRKSIWVLYGILPYKAPCSINSEQLLTVSRTEGIFIRLSRRQSLPAHAGRQTHNSNHFFPNQPANQLYNSSYFLAEAPQEKSTAIARSTILFHSRFLS